MKTLLKASGEVHAEFDDRMPVEFREAGAWAGGSFVAARAEPVAAALQPGAVVNPLAAPTVTGTTMTVDFALREPTRVITPMIMDITLQRFFVDRVFSSGGGVTGGAVIFNVVEANDLYAERDVQQVAPGAEFPVVTFQRRVPGVAVVEKWGGKFFITWEARDRNNVQELTNAVRQLSNTIVRKINQRGVAVLDAAVTTFGRTTVGTSWADATVLTMDQRTGANMPARDLAFLNSLEETEEMGMNFNLLIMNPQEYMNLTLSYGDGLNDVLDSFDFDIFVTNRVAAGTAYAVAEGQVGEMRLEQPLLTRSWDDPNGIEQTWVQSSVRPLFFVNNPFALMKLTGLAA